MRLRRNRAYIKRVKAGWEIHCGTHDAIRMMVALKLALEQQGVHVPSLLIAMAEENKTGEKEGDHEQGDADRQHNP